jgi:hypothetical protein
MPPAGWYPDPYRSGSERWFDGSVWTVHAVSAGEPHPDLVVESDWQGLTDEQLRATERFPGWDLAVPRDGERPYDGGGGWQGLEANRVGRWTMRTGQRWGPVHPDRWVLALTVVLAGLAWGDQRHRIVLAVAAGLSFVVTVGAVVRETRQRRYWRRAGESG